VKYEYKVLLRVDEVQDKEARLRVGVVCHQCNSLVETNRLVGPVDQIFTYLKSADLHAALYGHSCD